MTAPVFDLTYANLPQALYTPYQPEPTPAAKMMLQNNALATKLGIDGTWLSSNDALKFFSGQASPNDYTPIAMAYAGHQFGGFSPRLGDGRAVLMGEYVDGNNTRHDIHLKGSGRTTYSRGGDGKAALRAVLKEYIFSENLAALGIPTTRALAALTTDETVMRQKPHPGAILVRTARSHIRVGTFQYARLCQDETALKALADYNIDRLFPEIDAPNPYAELLSQTIEKQAKLIAKWMSFGFIHGVMNTDNMAISGETIDFGPCAFMEKFSPDRVFSSIDHHGRYAWSKQPEMAYWNLTRFAESLLPLLHTDEDKAVEIAQGQLAKFSEIFTENFNALMLAKIGLSPEMDGAQQTLSAAMSMLAAQTIDFTLFFRRLTDIADGKSEQVFLALFPEQADVKKWLKSWQTQLEPHAKAARTKMQTLNPLYIPRFQQLEAALEAAEQGDMAPVKDLLKAVTTPFDEKNEYADQAIPLLEKAAPMQTFCET
ncbi:MAG: YdiU family protein [Robiginitomaculum sp.]|nr:YdiU family protein [Robiginitomaculum sp.]